MKKSELYTSAMVAVLDSERFAVCEKLDILEVLMEERRLAKFGEEREAEKDAALS